MKIALTLLWHYAFVLWLLSAWNTTPSSIITPPSQPSNHLLLLSSSIHASRQISSISSLSKLSLIPWDKGKLLPHPDSVVLSCCSRSCPIYMPHFPLDHEFLEKGMGLEGLSLLIYGKSVKTCVKWLNSLSMHRAETSLTMSWTVTWQILSKHLLLYTTTS